jgi:hypothetical protein
VPGSDICIAAKPLLFDHVVCALLEKSSLPCSLDCAE